MLGFINISANHHTYVLVTPMGILVARKLILKDAEVIRVQTGTRRYSQKKSLQLAVA